MSSWRMRTEGRIKSDFARQDNMWDCAYVAWVCVKTQPGRAKSELVCVKMILGVVQTRRGLCQDLARPRQERIRACQR